MANLPVSLKRLPATVTPGSGGSTPTPQATSPNDTAATVTAHVNDTARSTTSGTPSVLVADDFNVINGYLWLPPSMTASLPVQTKPSLCRWMRAGFA